VKEYFLRAALLFWSLATLPASAAHPPAPVQVLVARQAGQWTAEFHFPRGAQAWVFPRSALSRAGERPWRPQSWTVETPGVRLERRGRYDALTAGGANVPARVRIRFTPFSGDLIADFAPALSFTDGAVALFDGQYSTFPVPSAAAVDRLPQDLGGSAIEDSGTIVTFRDDRGRLLAHGRRLRTATMPATGNYVLFGASRPIVTATMATIIDPQLPRWIASVLARDTPEILRRYTAELGPAPGGKPTVMVSWAGPTPRMRGLGGSTLSGLIVMRFEGEGVLRESQALQNRARWFIAHESAHFWLGQAIHTVSQGDAWMTEGGADLLAMRTVQAMDPAYDWRAELDASIADCVRLSAGRAVTSAFERNEHRAYYACGAVFGLVAEAASHRPFSAFVRALVDGHRGDGVLTRAAWLAALDRASGDPSLSAAIAHMLDEGAPDPKAAIAAMFDRAGVHYRRGEDGVPRIA
jgi:hypothetical protein